MPKVARKGGADTVSTGHGCDSTTVTNQGSNDVFVNNIGVVRIGDLNQTHDIPSGDSCVPHNVALSTASPNVFANLRRIGRLGDLYGSEVITSGSPNVYANGA